MITYSFDKDIKLPCIKNKNFLKFFIKQAKKLKLAIEKESKKLLPKHNELYSKAKELLIEYDYCIHNYIKSNLYYASSDKDENDRRVYYNHIMGYHNALLFHKRSDLIEELYDEIDTYIWYESKKCDNLFDLGKKLNYLDEDRLKATK